MREESIFELARRALSHPGRAIALVMALARGHWYRIYYRMRGHRFRVGRGFKVFGRLKLKGPGRVVFGDGIEIWGVVTPWTHSPHARIDVGDNTRMAGTRIGAADLIRIGRDCIVADARIMDTDFHSTRPDRRSAAAPIRVAPVEIADNVWISAGSAILPGSRIGENSVVGFGAVCVRDYPADTIIMGNPARVVAPVPAVPVEEPEEEVEPMDAVMVG